MKIVQFKRNIKSGSIRRKVDLIHIIINACEMINLNQFMSLENIDKLEGDYPFIIVDDTIISFSLFLFLFKLMSIKNRLGF